MFQISDCAELYQFKNYWYAGFANFLCLQYIIYFDKNIEKKNKEKLQNMLNINGTFSREKLPYTYNLGISESYFKIWEFISTK